MAKQRGKKTARKKEKRVVPDDVAHILATFNVDQHGNSPVTMFCELEDDGSATVPSVVASSASRFGRWVLMPIEQLPLCTISHV